MAIRYDQVLKKNQELSKSLTRVTDDLDLNSMRLQALEDQVVEAEKRERNEWNNARKIEDAANSRIREYKRATGDKHACLLALMVKLFSAEEEAKWLRKQVEETRRRSKEINDNLQELSENIDHVRNHSRKISEKLSDQRSSIANLEGLTDRCFELELNSQRLQKEKEQTISELNDLKRWAEALKARYDIVEKNNQQCQESYNNVVVDCSQVRRQNQELQFQLAISQRQESNLKAQNDELTRYLRNCQEQRDLYSEERLIAIDERDKARKERDEMYQKCSDTQKEKDEALRRLFQETREFERRQEVDTAELQVLRERLVRTEEELQSLKMEREFSLSNKPSRVSVSILYTCFKQSPITRHKRFQSSQRESNP